MWRVKLDATPFLRVRCKPNGDIIGKFAPAKTLNVQSIEGGWAQVKIDDDVVVWVSAAYIEDGLTQPPPFPEPDPPKWSLPFTADTRFVHASAGGWAPDSRQIDLVEQNKVKGVLIVAYEANQQHAVGMFRSAGVKHFIIRAATHDEYQHVPDAMTYVERTLPRLKQYAQALGTSQDMMIAVHNEPNLYKEGLGYRWQNGVEFAEWFVKVAAAYRDALPGCKIGFPGLSPGGAVANIRADEATFIREAKFAIERCDWAGVHWYWLSPSDPFNLAAQQTKWRQMFGALPLVATEVGPVDASHSTSSAVMRAYAVFAQINVPCVSWLLNGAGMWANAAWDKQGIVL